MAGWLAFSLGPLAATADADPNPLSVLAVEAALDVAAASPPVTTSPEPLPDYSDRSDLDLTELGARWDDLSRQEKDALLREVKLRMAKRKDADGMLMIRTQRRYGRIYRSEDGRYLKIETQVVRVRPVNPDTPKNAFGVGFEQRSATLAAEKSAAEADGTAAEEALQPPVVRVRDPSQ